jgi:transcriptional regulator with PAS, ATPase and Fis domain
VPRVLVSWVGATDLAAPEKSGPGDVGPIMRALETGKFARVLLVTDYAKHKLEPYVRWVRGRSDVPLAVVNEALSSPMNFGEIYEAAVRACTKALVDGRRDVDLTFHLSPGTSAMAAVWIILAKTRFPAELIQSSQARGVEIASVPFDISVDFIPDLLRERDEHLREMAAAGTPETPEFSDILHRSASMARVIREARKWAGRSVPILIEGETGTGKEMLARAIHRTSPRRAGPFVAVNCGAIPETLVESELFGHEKGAFTGADHAHQGCFEAADGGTLFLDEVGELPRQTQVKLLRVLQDQAVTRIGGSRSIHVNLRVMAATNRVLTVEVRDGRFREDLYYRLAVGVLSLPSLRERGSDLGLLIDRLLVHVNEEAGDQPGFVKKNLSVGARNLLLRHAWPGNVRELKNTLTRVAVASEGVTILADDVREALRPGPPSGPEKVLGRTLGDGFNLNDLLKEVARDYLARALAETAGNKTTAARLLGLRSYQALNYWLKRHELDR